MRMEGFMMLELVAEKLTACFDKRLTLSEIERLKMILGFESLLHQFVLIGIIIIFACVLEIVRPVTLFLAVFGTYRTFAGGFHLSTSLRCTIATTAIMIIGTKLALAISMKIGATFLIWAVILVIVWFYVPRLTSNHPIEQEQCKKLKAKTVWLVVLLGIIAVINPWETREIISMAAMIETFTLIPKPE